VERDFDLIVIGSGPGGYVAALRAAQRGLRTALIEREHWGGVCLNWGCIPTKALLRSAHLLQDLRGAQGLGVALRPPGGATAGGASFEADLGPAVRRSRQAAERLVKGVRYLLDRAGIALIEGHARLHGRSGEFFDVTVARGGLGGLSAVSGSGREGEEIALRAARVVLAAGARPRELRGLPFDGRDILSSRDALALMEAPKRLLVVGAGAIGMEFADVFQSFGTQVTVVEMLPRVLPEADAECSAELACAFARRRIAVHCGTIVAGCERGSDGLRCRLAPAPARHPGSGSAARGAGAEGGAHTEPRGAGAEGQAAEREVVVDRVLIAAGVIPNSEDLGLETVGLEQGRGFVPVDEHLRTRVASLYAIGDLIGAPLLAHAASAEGLHAVDHAAGRDPASLDHRWTPGVVFTEPGVAAAGLTEEAARAEQGEVRVGRFPFRANGRALAEGAVHGFVKVILAKAGTHLLGAHVVGPSAGELIAELALIGRCRIPVRDALMAVHPHPSFSEAVPEAIEAALGEALHV